MSAIAFSKRNSAEVMSAQRARGVVPDPLSFPRAAMSEMVRSRFQVDKLRFELDADGRGEVLYRLRGEGHIFYFFLISDKLPEDKKTDRNFAASWDAMGVLCQGEWNAQREALLRREVPKQRAGFADYGTLIYARGNRSTRIFNSVVESLAQGLQPNLDELASVGYILRTTAFIGNGQLGTLPLDGYGATHPLRRPYHAQFCSAFMLREYVFDLGDHLARIKSPKAVRLAPEYRRFLGLGNSAATGLAAYATNHPHQINQWSQIHESALVDAINRMPVLSSDMASTFESLLNKAATYFAQGSRPDDGVFVSPQDTAVELRRIEHAIRSAEITELSKDRQKSISLERLLNWSRVNVQSEACEVLNSLILELHPDIIEGCVNSFQVVEKVDAHPEMRVGELLIIIENDFDWIIAESKAKGGEEPDYFWYRCSSAPRDVRRGLRRRLTYLEFETDLDLSIQVLKAWHLLRSLPASRPIAGVLCERPDLRHAILRVQSLTGANYSSLRQPWLSASFTPFESIRFVLAFYGMEKFEAAFPKSVRGTFMQGAPIAEDMALGRNGRWPFTLKPDPENPGAESELAPLPLTSGIALNVVASDTAPEPQVLTIGPGELARAVQTALQGHGMLLGVAEEAGTLVSFSQQRGEPAVAVALDHCANFRVCPFTFPDAERSWPVEGGPLILQAHRASSLAAASSAMDLAIERCLHSHIGTGAVLMVEAQDAWLGRAIVLRGARKGLLTVMLWRSTEVNGKNVSGYSMAGPQLEGPWYNEGHLTENRETIVQSLAASINWTPLQDDGFLLVCMRPESRGDHEITPISQCHSEVSMAMHSAQNGIKISRNDYNSLLKAGTALLVPESVEHLILNQGADPLKSF
jgi:hypothetical protein